MKKKSSSEFLKGGPVPTSRSRISKKIKKGQQWRSDCPINFSLEIFGDIWSLLIVRDIVYFGKKTYGEFLESEEGIATNILARRLIQLEQKGILKKQSDATDRRKEVYSLTDKGLDLIPILLELASWGAQYNPQADIPHDWIALVNSNKTKIIRLIRTTLQDGGSVFIGKDSLVKKLGL